MSLVIRSGPRRAAPPVAAWLDSLPLAVATGVLLVVLMTAGQAVTVWRTGMFFGPDDAMRAVEVRDFLGGQGWFDLVPRRLSPDHSFAMHWSRLADLPLAAAMRMFGWFMDAATAERLTRLLEPALFYVLTLSLLARLSRGLCGPRGALAAALLSAGALDAIGDFLPGRIHHHALQILLLMVMVTLACDGLDAARARRMVFAGAAGALSLAINLQNMPFVAATAGLVAALWAFDGEARRAALGWFGLGLGGGALAVFVAEVPPSNYLQRACDAFGAPHLLAAVLGGGSFILLSCCPERRLGKIRRCAVLAAAGLLVLAALRAAYPACLGDPYAAVDPSIREKWMAEVGEAMPLGRLLWRDPLHTVPIVVALLVGMGTTGAAALVERGLAQRRWILLLGLEIVATLGTAWQVRVAASAEILAAAGGAWLLCRLFARPGAERPYAALLAVVTGLAMTPAGWTAAAGLVPGAPPPVGTRSGLLLDPVDSVRCFEPASYDDLNRLPRGLVLSTIDPGAHILAYTAHEAIAAPYHRDDYGLRLALTVFTAPVAEARRLVAESKADYVALCTASPEVHDFTREAPEGFAARILGGEAPPWLTPIAGSGPFRLYAVRLGPAR